MRPIKFEKIGTKQIPESWAEVTVHQYIKIHYEWDGQDPIRLLAHLINEDYSVVFELGEDPEKVQKVLQYLLSDVHDWEKLKKVIPKSIEVQGKTLIIKPIHKQSLGQKVYLEQLAGTIKGDLDRMAQLIPAVCAIYLSPQFFDSKTFSVEQSEQLTEIILQEPIVKIIPVASFFLGRSRRSLLRGINAWRPQSLNKQLRKRLLDRAADLMSLKK